MTDPGMYEDAAMESGEMLIVIGVAAVVMVAAGLVWLIGKVV